MEQDEALIFLEAYGDEFRSLAATTGDQAYRDTAVRALRVELGATMAPLVAAKLGVAVADLLGQGVLRFGSAGKRPSSYPLPEHQHRRSNRRVLVLRLLDVLVAVGRDPDRATPDRPIRAPRSASRPSEPFGGCAGRPMVRGSRATVRRPASVLRVVSIE